MCRATIAASVLVLAAGNGAWAQSMTFSHEANVYDAKEGSLKAPEGVACSERYLVVGDTGNGRLLIFDAKAGRVTGGDAIKLPQLTSPVRVQIDSRGNALALDGKSHKVVRVAANGSFGGLVEPTGLENASALVVGAFKVDARDTIYLLDIAGRRVVLVDANGAFASALPLPKEAVAVTDIAVDVGGNVYAVDAVAGALWIADKGGGGFRSLATNLKDKMNFPIALAASKGRLFAVDQHGNGVVIFGIDGSYMGRQLSLGATSGLVNYPGQLCLTEAGVAYLADTLNNRVQEFSTGKQ